MKEVYLVTKGKYSDYSVHGVFIDKAIAEEYAAQITDMWSVAQVSTRPIYDSTNLTAPIGFRGYNVLMDRHGNSEVSPDLATYDDPLKKDYAESEMVCDNNRQGKYVMTGQYNFYVLTDKGEEAAIKIANERRVRMIAENKFPVYGTPAYDDQV